MADPRVVSIPKAPPIRDEVVRRLVLAKIASDGRIVLGQGVPLVYVETLADAPTGLLPGTVAFGQDGSFAQVNSSGTLVSRGAAGSLAVASGGALTFDGTDIVLTADGTDVDLTGTGKLDARDDVLHFVDPAAPTKRVRIDAGAVTAGQTRVLAMPDANVTIGAYGPTLLNVADEAAFKAAVNLEIGTDVQAYNANLAALAAGTAAVVGPVSSPMTAAQVLTNGATVTLPTTGKSKSLTSASAVTGIILAAGTVSGQEIVLMNANAADSITFDGTPATSNIAQAVHLIAAGTSKVYTWNPTAARWFPAG